MARIIFSDFREPAAGEAYDIAYDYIQLSGKMRDEFEACVFLSRRITAMVDEGQNNKLRIANRAIAEYDYYVRECERVVRGDDHLEWIA
jgi:hypothetical protein